MREEGETLDMRPLFSSGLGKVAFNLDSSHANLIKTNGVYEQAQVRDSALSVDFTSRTFDTSLSVFHDETGLVNINSKGEVNRFTGIMLGRNNDIKGNGRVVGALSLDGKEAGLTFERQVDQGLISGITLWSR